MLRICAEMIDVGASLVGAQATRRIQPAESYEGNHKGCPYSKCLLRTQAPVALLAIQSAGVFYIEIIEQSQR